MGTNAVPVDPRASLGPALADLRFDSAAPLTVTIETRNVETANATVTLLVRLVTASPPAASPAAVAVVRTGVLAVTAVALAMVGRRPRLAELGWLVHPLLVLGLAKLVFEDLGRGNPVALTVGFGLFGGALIMAPRLLRSPRRAG
ncbi:MAG: hypothetical protein IH621_11760 [Krumholzibacteria bacterium]|nr:hypothetical protein [Candidatus Krumholzibacteria bacterium]